MFDTYADGNGSKYASMSDTYADGNVQRFDPIVGHKWPVGSDVRYHFRTVPGGTSEGMDHSRTEHDRCGHPFSLITLATYSTTIFGAFRQRSNELYIALKALQKGVRSGMATDLELDTTPIPGPTADVADGSRYRGRGDRVESVDFQFYADILALNSCQIRCADGFNP
jgi:hypothetical protein